MDSGLASHFSPCSPLSFGNTATCALSRRSFEKFLKLPNFQYHSFINLKNLTKNRGKAGRIRSQYSVIRSPGFTGIRPNCVLQDLLPVWRPPSVRGFELVCQVFFHCLLENCRLLGCKWRVVYSWNVPGRRQMMQVLSQRRELLFGLLHTVFLTLNSLRLAKGL